eukprot:1030858-Alexandrium_andersonii.AAC.1
MDYRQQLSGASGPMPRQRARKDCASNEDFFENLLDDPRQGLLGDIERCGPDERCRHLESLRCCTPRAVRWLRAAVEFRPRPTTDDRERSWKLLGVPSRAQSGLGPAVVSLFLGSRPYVPHQRCQSKHRVQASVQRAPSGRRAPEVRESERSDGSGPFAGPITEA